MSRRILQEVRCPRFSGAMVNAAALRLVVGMVSTAPLSASMRLVVST